MNTSNYPTIPIKTVHNDDDEEYGSNSHRHKDDLYQQQNELNDLQVNDIRTHPGHNEEHDDPEYVLFIPKQSVEKFNSARPTFSASSDVKLNILDEASQDVPIVTYSSSMLGASEQSKAELFGHQSVMAHYQPVVGSSGAKTSSQIVEAKLPLSIQFLPRPKPNKCLLTTTEVAATLHFICITIILLLQISLDYFRSHASIVLAIVIFDISVVTVAWLTILSYKYSYRKRGISIALLVLSIITLTLALVLITFFAATDTSLSTLLDVYPDSVQIIHVFNGGLVFLTSVEFGLCIWTAVLSCEGLCWCCRRCHSDLSKEK